MKVVVVLLLVMVAAAVALMGLLVTTTAAEETDEWDEGLERSGAASEVVESLRDYDPASRGADHTAFAIAFAEAGEVHSAGLAFTAAVRHNRNANTLVNLGVFMMRQRRFTGPGEALDSMWQAKTRYRTEESAPLINENWDALMQTMRALSIPVPERYQNRGAAGVDALPSFTDDDTDWQAWFGGDETADDLLAYGIQKDTDGDLVTAGRALLAAVRTRTDALTLINWGVFMMSRAKYHEALKAIHAARVTYRHTAAPDRLSHIDENWCVLRAVLLRTLVHPSATESSSRDGGNMGSAGTI